MEWIKQHGIDMGKMVIDIMMFQKLATKYNLMDLLSSIGIQQLKQININHKIREKVWKQYDKSFKKSNFRIPSKYDKSIYKHAYHLYNIFLNKKQNKKNRDELILELHKQKIGVGIHYKSIPEHSIYKKIQMEVR